MFPGCIVLWALLEMMWKVIDNGLKGHLHHKVRKRHPSLLGFSCLSPKGHQTMWWYRKLLYLYIVLKIGHDSEQWMNQATVTSQHCFASFWDNHQISWDLGPYYESHACRQGLVLDLAPLRTQVGCRGLRWTGPDSGLGNTCGPE